MEDADRSGLSVLTEEERIKIQGSPLESFVVSQAWWCMPLIPELRGQRQVDVSLNSGWSTEGVPGQQDYKQKDKQKRFVVVCDVTGR